MHFPQGYCLIVCVITCNFAEKVLSVETVSMLAITEGYGFRHDFPVIATPPKLMKQTAQTGV